LTVVAIRLSCDTIQCGVSSDPAIVHCFFVCLLHTTRFEQPSQHHCHTACPTAGLVSRGNDKYGAHVFSALLGTVGIIVRSHQWHQSWIIVDTTYCHPKNLIL